MYGVCRPQNFKRRKVQNYTSDLEKLGDAKYYGPPLLPTRVYELRMPLGGAKKFDVFAGTIPRSAKARL